MTSFKLGLLVDRKCRLEKQWEYLMAYRAFDSSDIPVRLYPFIGRFIPYFRVLHQDRLRLIAILSDYGYSQSDLDNVAYHISVVEVSLSLVRTELNLNAR